MRVSARRRFRNDRFHPECCDAHSPSEMGSETANFSFWAVMSDFRWLRTFGGMRSYAKKSMLDLEQE